MTHDLFKTVLDDLGTKVLQVVITELHDGTFYAEIEFARDGGTYRISSRPSDAIALAVRYGEPVPIFANEEVLDEAGVLFEQDEDEERADRAVPGVPRPGAPRRLRPGEGPMTLAQVGGTAGARIRNVDLALAQA